MPRVSVRGDEDAAPTERRSSAATQEEAPTLRGRGGFTLIEILITLTVIAVLSGISLVSLQGSRLVARDGQRKTELEQIRSALEIYRTDNGSYPTDWDDLVPDYMGSLPEDPLPNSYDYEYSSDGVTYTICAHLEAESAAVVGCGGDCGATCTYIVTSPSGS